MSEDIADIIFEDWFAVLKELHGNRNPEYVEKKMTLILNELKKIWNNKS